MSDVAKTPREELECKKKYLYEYSMFWECNDGSKCQILEEDVCDLLNEQQATINNQDEEIKKLKKTERSWRKIHCCNKESNNCGIVIEQQNTINELMEENEKLKMKIVSLENEIQRQTNELKNTRKEFTKKTEELNWLKSEDYLKKIY